MNTQKGNAFIVALVLLAVVAGVGVLFYSGAKDQQAALEAPLPVVEESVSKGTTSDAPIEIGAEDEMLTVPNEDSADSSVQHPRLNNVMEARSFKEFNVTAKNFEFSMKEIRVRKGDFVRINFTSTDGFHDWVVSEFNAKTAQVPTGSSSSVDFVVDKAGTFEFYCSVGTHRSMGMVGKLIVE